MKLRTYILLIMSTLVILSCSSYKEEQDKITVTVEKFYKAINNSNYKEMDNLCSDNMHQIIRKFKEKNIHFAKYKKYSIRDIELSTDKAVVTVDAMDEFNNKVTNIWDLIHINNLWKINNYNFSHASVLNATPLISKDSTNDIKESLNNEDSI